MPNLWEYEQGLDPNFPIDAIYDPDDDELSNRYEYEAGSDPFNPDTDGDGIIDGRDGNPTNYMRPTGGLIIFFSILTAGIISSITVVIVKRVQRKKREFRETYFFCPKCSMKNYRAKGVCIYCGEEIDPSKIETMVKKMEKGSEIKNIVAFCDSCGSPVKNGKCTVCGNIQR